MAGNLKKVAGGDRLRISAAAYNAFIDAALAHTASQSSQESDSGVPRGLRNDLILVLNSSGANRGQSEILGIQSPLVLPTKNLNEFQNRLGVIGVVPVTGAHVGKFVVLVEPIPKDGIGYGWITGLAQVQVEVVREGDTSAEIVGGRTTSLKGGAGTIPIVWKETGTGIRWAIVRLGGGGGGGGGGSALAVVRETWAYPLTEILVEEVILGENGYEFTGIVRVAQAWPGLASENYAALRSAHSTVTVATIVVAVRQIGAQFYVEQWSGLRYRLAQRPRNVRWTDCIPIGVEG